jgi:hypothetical protein
MMYVDMGLEGGFFGLMETNLRMTADKYRVYDREGGLVYGGTDWEKAKAAAQRWETFSVIRDVYDWSMFALIAPQDERKIYGPEETSPILNSTVRRVEKILKDRPECRAIFAEFTDEQLSKALNYGIIAHHRGAGNLLFHNNVIAETEAFADDDVNLQPRLIDGLTTIDSYDGGENDENFFEPSFGTRTSAKDWGISKRHRRILKTSDDFRVMIILHELAHKFDPTGKFDDDMTTPNGTLNSAIIDNCLGPTKTKDKKWWKPWTWGR